MKFLKTRTPLQINSRHYSKFWIKLKNMLRRQFKQEKNTKM